MRRIGTFAALSAAMAMSWAASEAQAQVFTGPTIIGGNSHGRFHSHLARRELDRQRLHAAAHARGLTPRQHATLHRLMDNERAFDSALHDDFHFHRPPVVFLPPATRASMNPFGGSPHGGNYFYWLSREYVQGRVPKAEFNRQFYGIGR